MRLDKSPRHPLDYYPTPADVTHAMAQFIIELGMTGPCLDPAAGSGDLIEGCRDLDGEAHWSAIEIDPGHAETLERLAVESVHIADALAVEWPKANVMSNPPFCLLDAFWQRIATARSAYGCFAAVLAPVAWFSAEKRKNYVRPDHILQLGWRPVFRKQKTGPGHKGSQDFAWLVLEPNPRSVATWRRVDKPPKSVRSRRKL